MDRVVGQGARSRFWVILKVEPLRLADKGVRDRRDREGQRQPQVFGLSTQHVAEVERQTDFETSWWMC